MIGVSQERAKTGCLGFVGGPGATRGWSGLSRNKHPPGMFMLLPSRVPNTNSNMIKIPQIGGSGANVYSGNLSGAAVPPHEGEVERHQHR